MSIWATSSNNTAESKDVGGKQFDYYRPQLFVFYSCISSTHRPGFDATVGERSMQFQKNPTLMQDLSRRCIAMRGGECVSVPSTKSRSVWQCGRCRRTSSRSNRSSIKRTAPPSSTHVHLDDVPLTLDPAKCRGKLRQHDGMVTVMVKWSTQGFA